MVWQLRQYIVTDNDEERPFRRDQRRWVYASAVREARLRTTFAVAIWSFRSAPVTQLSRQPWTIRPAPVGGPRRRPSDPGPRDQVEPRCKARGLDPTLKSVRFAGYVATLRHELLQLSLACGVEHPALVGPDRLEIRDGRYGSTSVADLFGYRTGWGVPSAADRAAISDIMGAANAPQSQTFPSTNV